MTDSEFTTIVTGAVTCVVTIGTVVGKWIDDRRQFRKNAIETAVLVKAGGAEQENNKMKALGEIKEQVTPNGGETQSLGDYVVRLGQHLGRQDERLTFGEQRFDRIENNITTIMKSIGINEDARIETAAEVKNAVAEAVVVQDAKNEKR